LKILGNGAIEGPRLTSKVAFSRRYVGIGLGKNFQLSFAGYYLPSDLNFERTTSRFLITSFLGFFFSVKSRGPFDRNVRDREAQLVFK
jgi:hypothetical protein